MEDIIKGLRAISKLLNRVAFVLLLIVLWGELILMFTNYKSIGTLVYDEYGISGIGWYYLIFILLIFLLLNLSNKVAYITENIKTKLKDKEEEI